MLFFLHRDLLRDFSPPQPTDGDEEDTPDSPPSSPPPTGGVAVMQLSSGEGQPITALQFAADTGTTAPQTWLLHLTCRGQNAERDLQPAVDIILQHYNKHNSQQGPLVLYSLFFNQVIINLNLVVKNLFSPTPWNNKIKKWLYPHKKKNL